MEHMGETFGGLLGTLATRSFQSETNLLHGAAC